MLGVAALLFALGRRLFGEVAGTLAASLWLLSPFVLGLGHLDAVDPAFTLAVVGWSWALLRWTYRPTMLRAVIIGLLGAAVVLSDVTGLLVAALGLVVMLLYGRSRLPRWGLRHCVVAGAVSWAVVWVFYIALDPRVALDPTIVLPSPYFQGIRYLASNDTQPAPGYLLGAAWTGGQWWYWPGALRRQDSAHHTAAVARGADRMAHRRPLDPVACRGGVGCSGPAPARVHPDHAARHRLALPAPRHRPLAGGRLLARPLWAEAGPGLGAVAIVVAGIFTIGSVPDSLAWAAPPFAPASRSLTNSDVDWGQGLYLLQSWGAGKPPGSPTSVRGESGRTHSPDRIRSSARLRRVHGWVAVSAHPTLTSAERLPLAWLRAYCSVGELGGSILLYRFREHPTDVPGPTVPRRCAHQAIRGPRRGTTS